MKHFILKESLINYKISERSWECYDYSAAEFEIMYGGTPESVVCEMDSTRKFTVGNEALAPGCGGCWCCKEILT